MAGIAFRTAWNKDDETLRQDAVAFWRGGPQLLPQGVDPIARARELCAVAYRDGSVVGVSTVTIEFVPQFRSRMALYRCSAAPDLLTIPPLSWRITDYSREVLEKWSLENPDEKVMGLMAIIQAQSLIEHYPQIVAPANMAFTGFTPAGFPIRVAWFKHATIPTEWPPRPLPKKEPESARRLPAGTGFRVRLDRYIKSPKDEVG